jgi:hypothetical protein
MDYPEGFPDGLRTINKNGLLSVVKKLRAQGEKI